MTDLTCTQTLALEQIEAIVQDIEREKEAGASSRVFARVTISISFYRGGEEALEIGSNGSRTGGDDDTGRCWGLRTVIVSIVLLARLT